MLKTQIGGEMRRFIFAVLFWLAFAYSIEGTAIKSGKIYTNQTLLNDPGCAQVLFNSAFKQDHDIRVIVSLSHSDHQRPIHDPAALWVKQVTSRGFKVCLRKLGVGFNGTGVINWLALRGTMSGLEQGVVSFDQWGAGTQCKTIQPNKLHSKPLRVLATVLTSNQSTRHDAMYMWVTRRFSGGDFEICLKEVTTFDGIHKQLEVNWIAFDETSDLLNITESKNVFLNDRHLYGYIYCKKVDFTKKFYSPPVVVATPGYYCNDSSYRPVTQKCKAMTSWVEEITTSYYRLCARELPGTQYRDCNVSVNYVAIGDVDPCFHVTCGPFAFCKAFSPNDARCICFAGCPKYEEQLCSSNGTTFINKCFFELEMCRQKKNHTSYHPGSCRGFQIEKGRNSWPSKSLESTVCKYVKFRPYAFYPDKRVHVHLTVNHINTTNLDLVHDATASWVENVDYQGFTACLTTAGRGEGARATQASFDWFAYQGAPDGGVTDRTTLNKWWTGTSCKTIQLPKDKFQTEPTVIVTAEHISGAFKHDAANIWLEKINKTAFMVCLRELQNFDGLHEDVHVSWMAFDKIHQPVFSEKGIAAFSNTDSPSMKYNGAFCKDLKYIKRYNHVPIVILSTNHKTGNGASKPVCNGVSTWIEYIDKTGFRVCLKELYTDKYEPLSVNYIVLSDICDPGWNYFDGVCFKTSSSCQKWIDAENHCRSSQATLATIRSQRENVFVQQQLNGHMGWIGLNDRSVEGHFRWSSALRENWAYWAANQPNNVGNEDCVHTLGVHHTYEWNDVPCDDCHNFTCAKDMNECLVDQDSCHSDAVCTNTYGSHTCQCKTGFSGDGSHCTDIDECSTMSPCDINATCSNVQGSYTCRCNDGYSGDGHSCTDIDECVVVNVCDPNAVCTNTPGSYSCTCKVGHYGNGTVCSTYKYRGLQTSVILRDYGNTNYYQILSTFLDPVLQSNSKSHWIRCWHAGTDGWNVDSTFHAQCDGKGPTVTLVRVGSYVFGGYSDVSWDRSNSWGYSSRCFLYSLYNTYGYYPLKMNVAQHKSNAVSRNSGYGPIFGGGHDLMITNYASSNANSCLYVHTYSAPPGCSRGNFCSFYTGSGYFTASDIEVYYETTN